MMGRWRAAGLAVFLLATGCQLASVRSSAPQALRGDPSWVLVPDLELVSQRGRHDCGVAALTTVVGYWQPAATMDSVAQAVGPIDDRRGVPAGRLRAVAQAHGLKAFLIEGSLDDLQHEVVHRRPVILGLVGAEHGHLYGHYDVVVGVNPSRRLFLLADPRGAWRQVKADDLLTVWRPTRQLALVIFP
jgi:ABC-type bacteriocin/lantibiotic exporter with double-glycine peptidase domain